MDWLRVERVGGEVKGGGGSGGVRGGEVKRGG